MRRSTAAGINNSLLPRDCSCGEFACSAVWGRDLFLAFVLDLPMVLYWKRLLSPGICGIRLIRYRREPPVVRDAFSGAHDARSSPSVSLRAKGRKWQILDCLLRKISYLCEWSTKRL